MALAGGFLYYIFISKYHNCKSFNLIFSLSCLFFELLLYDSLCGTVSQFTWKILFLSMVISLVIVIPFNIARSKSFINIIMAVIIWIVYGMFLWKRKLEQNVDALIDDLDYSHYSHNLNFNLEWIVGRIGLLGSLMIAILSGYGSVINPFYILISSKVSNNIMKEGDNDNLNHRHDHVQYLLREKKKELDKIAKTELDRKWFQKLFTNSSYDGMHFL